MKTIFKTLIILILLYACSKEKSSNNKIFRALNHNKTGINFANNLKESDSLNYLNFAYIYMGGGVAVGDINNDGLSDLFFTGNMVNNRLYLNKGNLKFEDISKKAGVLGDKRWFTGVTMADVNNDGYLDIYCSVGGKFKPKKNLLYINNGDLTFTESAEKYGIADVGNSIQATFFDYDKDGDLDLYVANYPPTRFDAPNYFYKFKMEHPADNETDKLFRNDGNKFTDVTNQAGLRTFGLSNSVTIGDLNNDGWPDIYVSNDFNTPDFLYINNKNGTFTNQIQNSLKQTALYGMGVDIADFNNDNLLDIIQMDMTPGNNRRSKADMASMNPSIFWSTVNSGFGYQYMQNMLDLNNGFFKNSTTPDFSNISRLAGVATSDWSWGPLFADLDNDGWKDIFISNGIRRDINNKDYFNKLKKEKLTKDSLLIKTLGIPSEKIDNFVFKNMHDLTFKKVNKEWGLTYKGFSNGCAYADLDNDGDLDIIINNVDDYASIFENTSNTKTNHYITLKFKGPAKNKFGLGVKATLKTDSLSQFQEMTLTRGFQSSVAPRLHFGLGKANIIKLLKIQWPDGKNQELTNIKANQILNIDYKKATMLQKKNKKIISKKLFKTITDTTLVVRYSHNENYFNDYSKESLLPHQNSTLGPYISVGDLNGDGLDDFIVSGAHNFKTAIFYQNAKGGFKKQDLAAISQDSAYEDLGCLIFDADGDGDNDIYMVSGGNEFNFDSEMLQDRLYINDGKGNFTKSANALPKMITSGSKVYADDFDKDGDLDLYVAGRLVPGNYPMPANSYLLENVSTKNNPNFKNVTRQVAPQFKNLGLATSALWTDYNGDGWDDLIVVGEWMPITIFKNNHGHFTNVTKNLHLEHTTGWWYSVKGADFDDDGDQDYIIGNLGLNNKYQASKNKSFDIYLNDFDKNKTNDIVLSYFNEGKHYPVRGLSCSSTQMPAIKRKFKNYNNFANATLVDIYTKRDLDKSLHYSIESFASIYLENTKQGFKIHKLPNLAQVSNINQILIKDFDHDAKLDAVIAGNLFNFEVETPRNDAGIGLLLKGDGKGHFKPVKGDKSGLYAPGNVKDMAIIRIQNKKYIIFAKNNDYLQFVKIQ